MRAFILIFLSLFLLLGCDNPKSWTRDKFDKNIWRQTNENSRYKLVNDLIDSHILDGQTEPQVIELLGPPTSNNTERISYIIKLGGGGFDQVYILEILFGENLVVENYYVRGD